MEIAILILKILAALVPFIIGIIVGKKALQKKAEEREAKKDLEDQIKTAELIEALKKRELERQKQKKNALDHRFEVFEFKYPHLEDELKSVHPRLTEIVKEFSSFANQIGLIPVITRVKDPIKGSTGIHSAGRAVDIRDEHDGVFMFTKADRERLIAQINKKFEYLGDKKTIIWHSFEGRPHHFHIQVDHRYG